ncbi:MAG: hypothetical protein OEV66_02425 [Spirochaetia bacterium]|nr:hypothetical protein [Spirochaetia bacterium]
MKKNTIIFLFLFCSTQKIFSEQISDGFLGVNLSLQWEQYQSIRQRENFFMLPLTFSGASAGYDIMTDITINPELLHLDKYYSAKFSGLNQGAVQPFSLASLEVLYKLAEWKIFHFNGGLKIGHYGFLSNDWSSPAFLLFIGARGSIFTFLGDHFMVQIPLEIPLALYLHNLNDFFMAKTGVEVIFYPAGPIQNPMANSAVFCLGMEYSYLHMQTSSLQTRNIHYITPYIKVTVLY